MQSKVLSLSGIDDLHLAVCLSIGYRITEQIRYGYTQLLPTKSVKIPKGDNQNPYIEEQKTQWPKEKVQKENNDLQNMHTKDRVLNTNLTKDRGKLR